MSVDTLCFRPFPSQRRSPAVFVFFSLHQVNFVVEMLKRQQAVQGCQSIRLAEAHRSQVPVDKSAFSLPTEYMCMFKAHPLSLERLSFPFGEQICLTLSTFSGFSSSLNNEYKLVYPATATIETVHASVQ